MKVLITGGAGFIGSHLTELLLARGDEVFIIDDLSTGYIENIAHLKDNPLFHYTIDSITNQPLTAELVDRCSLIVHLAAAVGVKRIVDSPVNTIETNIYGTEIILKLANKKGKKVIVASSSEVYGKNDTVPFKEDADMVLGPTIKARWSYACSKAVDEFLALAYHKEKKLPVIIVRLFNTVGPRQTGEYGMVLPTFVQQALLGHPITVYGDGQQSRNFTYVKDVVQAMVALAEHPDAVGQVFNIGNEQAVKIEALADLVKKKTQSKSPIVCIPYDEAYEEGFEDMRRRIPDITKIRRLIGFEPSIGIEEIVDSVIDYYKR